MTKGQPLTRHIVSINDLTNKEIETIFEVAQGFLKELAAPKAPYRIARSTLLASKSILATLFYEPSTRTRLSFESAMLRLGGSNITSADPGVSSAAKGESLADTIRVIGNYADIVVIRHPRDGAARLATEYAQIPVINGGDGSHEHPTQTLCDLFTLRAKNKNLRNMKVAISGDLKGSRTIHSFVYALARFGATIDPLPAPGMELPAHVDRRLREEFHSRMVSKETSVSGGGSIDALYVTADQPHQLSLYAEPEVDYGLLQKKIDAVYVTRFQKERWAEKERPYPKVDAKFLGEPKFADASVMHPLPRVNELDAALDSDRRAVYFQQAAYGVPIRMALISLMLHLNKNKSLHQFAGGFAKPEHPVYAQPIGTGIHCGNPNCIVSDPAERQYAANKFYAVQQREGRAPRLRCVYCETDIDEGAAAHFVTADQTRRTFSPGLAALTRAPGERLRHVVIYGNEADALAAGFAPRDAGKHVRAG
jgi:aspartate carbamoyltransferase catalytic subunit